MKVIDVHVHLMGKTDASHVERFLDEARLDGVFLLSEGAENEGDAVRRKIEDLADLHRQVGDRLYPFARIDPTYDKAPEVLEWAVRSCGMVGYKMLPSNFHPEDPCARAVYETGERLSVPLLMHTGILWIKGNNANQCRPGNMEVMWDYPNARFAMAHIGWPWTDECMAVAQKMKKLRPEADQAFVDLTPGTPACYRRDAMNKCLEVVGADHMLYGSDMALPRSSAGSPLPRWRSDKTLLDELGVPPEDQQKIFCANALRFLGKETGE